MSLKKIADEILIIVGLVALDVAAFVFNLESGLVAVGISLFILDCELSS